MMKRLTLRRGVVLALALAVLAATGIGLWLGVFRQEQAAASPGPLDLDVVISGDPASDTTMAPGSIISYTVDVTSDGDTTAETDGDITLTIDLSNATLVGSLSSADGITCSGTDPIDCQVPDFTAAGSKTVSFDARVGTSGPVLVGAALDPPVDGSGVGEVDEGDADPDFDEDDGDDPLDCGPVGEGSDPSDEEPDNFDCTSHDVGNAELTITKVASPSEATVVGPDSTIDYTLTAANADWAVGTATDVVIRDYVGSGLTFVSAAPGTGVTCTDTVAPQINCTVARLDPGDSATVAIAVSVEASGGVVLNGAGVDPDDVITETNEDADDPDVVCGLLLGEGTDAGAPTEDDNYDCSGHVVGAVDLTITKSASPAETTAVDTGDTITYTLTVSNSAAAAATATSVPIRDYIGDGLTLSDVTPGTAVTCADTVAPEINCTASSIAPGQSRTVTIEVTVAATSGVVLNGARVDPENAVTEANDDADDPTLGCGDVGEGSDAESPTEADNYDCTSHTLQEVTPTPTPTAGDLLNCPLSGKWAISVWSGPSATATADVVATCTGVTIDAAYSLDRTTNQWWHYFPGRSDINNLLTVDDMQAIIALGR